MNTSRTRTNGFITVAQTQPEYLDMAVNLALTINRQSKYPCSVLVDRKLAKKVEQHKQIFDQVFVSEKSTFKMAKHDTPECTPYDNTIFIDADCLAVDSPDHLFPEIEDSVPGILMQGAWKQPDDAILHDGKPVSLYCKELGLRRYLKTNSGIIGFHKEGGIRLHNAIHAAERIYRATPAIHHPGASNLDRFHPPDEVLIGIASNQMDIDLFSNPVPNRWSMRPEFDYQATAPHKACFWHLIGNNNPKAFYEAYQIIEDARREKGLPVADGIKCIKRKCAEQSMLRKASEWLGQILGR